MSSALSSPFSILIVTIVVCVCVAERNLQPINHATQERLEDLRGSAKPPKSTVRERKLTSLLSSKSRVINYMYI